MSDSGEWNWNSLDEVLPQVVREKLIAVLIRRDDEEEDGLCWGPVEEGEFIVRLVYTLAINIH